MLYEHLGVNLGYKPFNLEHELNFIFLLGYVKIFTLITLY